MSFLVQHINPDAALETKLQKQVDYYHDKDDFKDALPYAKQWVQLKPNKEEARGELAYTLARLGDYKEAEEQYNQALTLHSDRQDNSRCVYLRDKAKWVEIPTHQYQSAYDHLTEYIEDNPKSASAIAARGEAALGLKEYANAINDLSRAVQLKPSKSSYVAKLANAYYVDGRLKDADSVLTDFIQNHSNDPQAWFNRAYQFQNNPEYYQRSIDDYNQVFDLSDDPEIRNDALYNRAGIKADLGHYETALDDISLYCKKVPDDADGYARRAWIYSKMNNFRDALHEYRTAANLAPNSSEIWANIAWANMSLKDYGAALKAAQEAVRLDPSNEYALRKLAFAYYDMANYGAAQQAVEQALAIDPKNDEALKLRLEIKQKLKA